MTRHERPISIYYHPQALQDLVETFSRATLADVNAKVLRLNGRPQHEIVRMLDSRSEKKIFQWEGSANGGTLRIIFAWGKDCLWMIGAFIKHNNSEGERFMKRIRPRAKDVKDKTGNDVIG